MEFSKKPDYMNERVFERNRLPARSYFLPKDTLLLSGRWRFHYATSPLDEAPSSDDVAGWTTIDVPGHMELQGFGHPHYTNFIYPFPCDPPNVPSINPVGHYETAFVVPSDWHVDGGFTYRLRFEGVDSAFYVSVNGEEIGYSQSSRNAAEFDITDVIQSKTGNLNTLRVKVFKWSDGSYIEDQDMWWLSGIFRDVYLVAMPRKAHIEDFFIRTSFDKHMQDGLLEVDITPRLDCAVELRLEVLDSHGNLAAPIRVYEMSPNNETVTYALNVRKPDSWTAETPNLYTLVMTLSANDITFQQIKQRFGFRTVEISRGLLRVNGTPILIKGTNRHDHHPRFGRAVPFDFIRHDLYQMKRYNFNAVRTSHYPNDPRLLAIADEIGLYVLDEADLECHGIGPAWDRLPSDAPSWKAAYVDRMKQLVHRDKNHPSVIMWSLGNESFSGQNHHAMYKWSKSYDKTRPVHYENDHSFPSSDVCSYMYLSPPDLANAAKQDDENSQKPVILCEYLHAMGNGPGSAKEYMETFRKYRRLQGGFIWEWANHGLSTPLKDGSGRSFYAYGGDFGDEPNDGNFVMDGLCDSEHMPGPGLIELKAAYQPVSVEIENKKDMTHVYVENMYDIQDLRGLECLLTTIKFGPDRQQFIVGSKRVTLDSIQPSNSKSIASFQTYSQTGSDHDEVWLQVSVRTTEIRPWADAGHEIAHKDICLHSGTGLPRAISRPLQQPTIQSGVRNVHLKLPSCEFDFDLIEGRLKSWSFQGREVISGGLGPQLSFWRAPSDNDHSGCFGDWSGHRISELTPQIRQVHHSINQDTGTLEILVEGSLAPPVLAWSFRTKTKYTFHSDGKILIAVSVRPSGDDYPDTVPRVGLEMTLPTERAQQCQWFGLGPHQTYRDMKSAGKIGIWQKKVDEMSHMFEMPQESGNRTGTRWVEVTNERGIGIRAMLRRRSDDSATKYTSLDKDSESETNDSSDDDDIVNVHTPSSRKSFTHTDDDTSNYGNENDNDEEDIQNRGFDFAISRYTAAELDRARHPHELPSVDAEGRGVNFRIDAAHHGVGSAACGPDVLDEYKLKTEDFDFEVELEAVRG